MKENDESMTAVEFMLKSLKIMHSRMDDIEKKIEKTRIVID